MRFRGLGDRFEGVGREAHYRWSSEVRNPLES